MDLSLNPAKIHPQPKDLRSFGLIVGSVFFAIGLWPLLHSESPRTWSVALGLALTVPGLAVPGVLLWPYRLWMVLGSVLGFVNTRILLGLIFYAVIWPMGAIKRRLTGDPLAQRFDPKLESYVIRMQPRPRKHFTKQF